MSCYYCMHKDTWRFSDFNYDYYLLWEMFFLLLGNLFSWSALKKQQTAVNSPVCIKCAFPLDSPCLVEVPLLCPPLWEMVGDFLKMGCRQQGVDTLCRNTLLWNTQEQHLLCETDTVQDWEMVRLAACMLRLDMGTGKGNLSEMDLHHCSII